VITSVWIVNFFLFFLISVLIGGDALKGKIEDGQYYFGDGDLARRVTYILFKYHELHSASVIYLTPLVILASFAYWISGGWNEPVKAVTSVARRAPGGLLSFGLYQIESLCWRVADFVASVLWVLLDSWREPDVEFFTRLSKRVCIAKMSEMLSSDLPVYYLDRPVSACISGANFCLFKHPRFHARKMPFSAVVGRFVSTRQGTYVRAWHRFPNGWILSLLLLSGSMPVILAAVFVSNYLPVATLGLWGGFASAVVFAGAILLFLMALSLLWLWMGGRVGRGDNKDLVEFLRASLDDQY
jgi:hypothetical protein